MIKSNLYKEKNYLIAEPCCLDCDIYEYDMRKANISVLLSKGIITPQQYEYYFNLPREVRQIQIGLLQRSSPSYSRILQEGIIEAKQQFFDVNDITTADVLAIKNDAVFLINRRPKVTQFGALEFVCKNHYTSFYKIHRLELYYFYDFLSKREQLDIKGMSEVAYELHRNYFIDFLKAVFQSAQLDPLQEVISLLEDFHTNFINNKLPTGYYREFNNLSKYRIVNLANSIKSYVIDFCNSKDIAYIDKSVNENILRQLYIMYTTLLQQQRI